MEYPFKLSEIIAGCESGSWLKGAFFTDEYGVVLLFDGERIISNTDESFNVSCGYTFLGYGVEKNG